MSLLLGTFDRLLYACFTFGAAGPLVLYIILKPLRVFNWFFALSFLDLFLRAVMLAEWKLRADGGHTSFSPQVFSLTIFVGHAIFLRD